MATVEPPTENGEPREHGELKPIFKNRNAQPLAGSGGSEESGVWELVGEGPTKSGPEGNAESSTEEQRRDSSSTYSSSSPSSPISSSSISHESHIKRSLDLTKIPVSQSSSRSEQPPVASLPSQTSQSSSSYSQSKSSSTSESAESQSSSSSDSSS